MFDKLAILAKDTKALADRVSGSGGAKKFGGDVLFAGEVPGIGTKVRQSSDGGWITYFVLNGFTNWLL